MSYIKPYQDVETQRQYRNHTRTQKKNISEMKEGVVVNSLIRDSQDCPNIGNMYDNLVIPDKTITPDSFERIDFRNRTKKEKNTKPKTLTPLLAATTALFGVLAGSMIMLASAAKHKAKLPDWKTLPEIPKNVAINNEPHFVTYLMIRDQIGRAHV